MGDINWTEIWQSIVSWLTSTGVKVLIAIILWIVSFKLTDFIFKRIEKRVAKKGKMDKTLSHYLVYIGRILIKVVIVAGLVGYLGINTSGLAAVLTSMGVGIGLAINGTLSNFAGGMLLLVTRPFKVDDYIEAAGYSGTVEEILIINTRLRTPDNKVVYVPNGTLSTTSIVNYSEKDTRRLQLVFSISYQEDFEKAKQIILKVCKDHPLVLEEPAPFVRVSAHSESSIDLTTRVWVSGSDYWTVNFDLLEQVKKAFDENGIEIPYRQVDVHMK
ncbi:MAG: mechanosensitive ion channel family protein [Clostridia bacterium]|nr:mechanosensitive ion channel family protein [Clostridia bacterium]